jgi:CCR4-NOT transcription complex subunit 1
VKQEDSVKILLQNISAPIDQPTHFEVPSTTIPAMSSSFVAGLADRISDGGIAQILSELGPSTTRSVATLRDVLADITRTSGPLTEAGIASFVYFFTDKSNQSSTSVVGLSSALLGSIVPGRGLDSTQSWNLDVVAQILLEDYSSTLDWSVVAIQFDTPFFSIKDTVQFRALLDLYRSGAKSPLPLSALTQPWRNSDGQLSIFETLMSIPPSVYVIHLNEDELADAAAGPPPGPNSLPNSQFWASSEILQRLLQLSDAPTLYRRVRDLFVRCLLACPEVLLCSLVRLQLRLANSVSDDLVNVGMQIKTELMRELIPLFFRPTGHHRVQNGPAALRRLYAISSTTVMAACFEAWRSAAQEGPQVRLAAIVHIINIARLLPSPAEAVATLLSGSRDAEYSISIAFVMADSDYLQLKPWLGEKLSSKASVTTFAFALVSYLRKTYTTAASKSDSSLGAAPLVSLENMATSLQLLQLLDQSILSQPVNVGAATTTIGENVVQLIEVCVSMHPSLRSVVSAKGIGVPAPTTSTPGASSDDVEEMATKYFQKIYTSEQTIGEVVEMLKRFKTSGNAKENEIFACMVHNLYDEYRFFAKYPEKELRITGILFGALIQEQLVSAISLGIALRYVLEALRKPPSPPGVTTSSGKMFKFGMFALEQFKGRLHEWPQYCSHIVQIPHLKDGYAELVAEIEQEMNKNQNRAPTQEASSSHAGDGAFGAIQGPDSLPDPIISVGITNVVPLEKSAPPISRSPRVAEFGPGLGRAVSDGTDEDQDFEAPPDATLDRVQFLVNNLAPSNVDKKATELKEMLDPKYFGWLGHFLVVKRISTQANFHSLYLSFLDSLGEYGKGLVEAILSSVYHSIGKLLRSQKITTSSSERSYLKNLGIWLGQITLARNRPIKQIMLDCKELLLQGYETGKLIAVAPFLAKTLEGAKNSIIFRPPNPWLVGLLGVFRSVYNVDGLKMNIKFEVEVLCKNLGIKLEDIPLRNQILSERVAPIKERNPDFNVKAVAAPKTATGNTRPVVGSPEALGLAIPGGDSGRTTPTVVDQQDTVIPNLAAYVTVNASLSQLLQSQPGSVLSSLNTASLKRWVPIAVDRAIREIIQPVVERSVTIACITTKEIVIKDFAMESDEAKMRKAGQLMVSNLAGSLALVTCREPLRASVASHLRQLLSSNLGRPTESLGEQEQNVMEQCVQICATDNLELGCKLIEKAATEKAVRDVDEALGASMNARRKHREQTGQPFYDMSIFSNGNLRYPAALPDQLRPKPGGLQAEHFQLYLSFQRVPRQQNQAVSVTAGQGATGLGSVREVLPVAGASTGDVEGVLGVKQAPGQQFNPEVLTSITSKLDAAVTGLLSAAGARAREIKLGMLPPEHQICQLIAAIKQVMPNASLSGAISRTLTTSEQELILGFSQGIFKRLYELSLAEPLRLEGLVAVLENINAYCPKLGKDMGTWATYAPTNTDVQRRLHRTVLLLLIRSRLLAVHDLDTFLAARADHGRNPVWVEFSLVFIRTAFMERIASSDDFPKLIELMTRIADGRSQAALQVAQSLQKPILQMLEDNQGVSVQRDESNAVTSSSAVSVSTEFHFSEGSGLSTESLSTFAEATKNVAKSTELFVKSDPVSARQQVTSLLETWLRLQTETLGNEKVLRQYLQVLQQWGVGKSEEFTERFLRLSAIIIVESVLKSSSMTTDGSKPVLSYGDADLYCRLLQLLFRHMNNGGTQDQVNAQRLGVLNKILGVIVRSMMWHYVKTEKAGVNWDQRPWFRLFMNLLMDLNKPEPTYEPIRLGILSIFGCAFHVCQPLVMPGKIQGNLSLEYANMHSTTHLLLFSGFAFAWLELVAHRHFLPNLLLFDGQKAWHIAHQLMIDQLLFLEPFLRRIELSAPIKKLYDGTLRVLLVLLHDFPSFLTSYHISFCNVIPESCVQLRNVILSATPKGMTTPDPFTPNLKIDLLPETSQSPTMLSNVLGPIENIQSHLEVYLKDALRRNSSGLLPLLLIPGTTEVDARKCNSLVVYVGAHALARLQSPQISLSRTPDIELFQKLMEFDDKGRYVCLNAIANQLRYPSSHTHYFSCVMLYLFSESKSVAVKEQVTRVLLERLIVNRPHPWGLLITFLELIKNQRYGFFTFPFTRCATEIEKVFESVARSCLPPGSSRSTIVVGDDQ